MSIYPDETGYVRHSETSRESAEALDSSGRAQTYDNIILQFLEFQGTQGATAEEVRKELNKQFPAVHNGSVNGRLSTLWRKRDVVKTKEKRKTDSNRQAHVYVHNMYRAHVRAEKEYSESVCGDEEALRELCNLLWNNVVNDGFQGITIEVFPLDAHRARRLAERANIKRKGQ